ncbi:Aldo/keto reductase [Amanita muscaria]
MSTTALEKKGNMPYVRLGKSGLKVSKIILGCMTFGTSEWAPWVLPEEESIKLIKIAYELGINTFDTADMYSNGVSETVLGKAIKELNVPREKIVVMTKLYWTVDHPQNMDLWTQGANPDEYGCVNQHGLSRKHIFDAVKASLKRLQVDYIDVLQCHRFDANTPVEETMQALHDVVKAGYVRYIGMSSCWAWQFHVMQNYAIAHNLTPFISMQNYYNLLYREEEREMFPTLKHFGVGSVPWSPLARGKLTRPNTRSAESRTTREQTDEFIALLSTTAETKIVDRVEEIAKKKDVSMAQVALAWMMSKEGITAPIVGTTSEKNLRDLVGAVHVELTEEDIKHLEELYQPQPIVGHA